MILIVGDIVLVEIINLDVNRKRIGLKLIENKTKSLKTTIEDSKEKENTNRKRKISENSDQETKKQRNQKTK